MTPLDAYKGIDGSFPIKGGEHSAASAKTDKDGASFQNVLGNLVQQVNSLQQDASRSIEGLATGETEHLHDVTARMEEAGIAFDLMMQVRNKLLDAYQQIMRMQV